MHPVSRLLIRFHLAPLLAGLLALTLPQHFKNHGYHSAALGKVFHVYAETGLGSEDDPASWSEPLVLPGNPVWGPEQEQIRAERRRFSAIARAENREVYG